MTMEILNTMKIMNILNTMKFILCLDRLLRNVLDLSKLLKLY